MPIAPRQRHFALRFFASGPPAPTMLFKRNQGIDGAGDTGQNRVRRYFGNREYVRGADDTPVVDTPVSRPLGLGLGQGHTAAQSRTRKSGRAGESRFQESESPPSQRIASREKTLALT
ncbi:MAG: hypothetical protein HRU17_01930 [Polyangiaceae bacterium]|nr:hypothetical protein [Polyangiaceae bacterium]